MTSSSTWDRYAAHRARFTDLLGSAANGSRVCLLGAGQCHDVDLEALASRFAEIHLVDIDEAAVLGAIERQPPAVKARLSAHAPVDLSGFEGHFQRWKRSAPTERDVASASAAAIASIARLPGPFDVVASACVLTQMSFRARDALGEAHPMLAPLRVSLVKAHVAILVGLTAPGGTALLVTDLTSSTSFPLGDKGAPRNLFDVMGDVIAAGAYYHAANPNLIEEVVQRDPVLSSMAGESELLEPWLWTGALDRTYLVYALRYRRA
jgi:hypothetical protein